MKTRFGFLSVLLLCAALVAAGAATASSAGKSSPPASKAAPGVELAHTVSLVTGIAISPLLGVSAVGCWQYFKAHSERRASLPFYARPWFWIPGLLVVAMVVAKDILGTSVPPGWK